MKLEKIGTPIKRVATRKISEEIEDTIKVSKEAQEVVEPTYADALRVHQRNKTLWKERTKEVRANTEKVRRTTAPQTKEIKESVLSDKGKAYLKREKLHESVLSRRERVGRYERNRTIKKNKQKLTEGTSNFKSYTNFPLLVFSTWEEVQYNIYYLIEDAYKEYINNKFPKGDFDELADYEQEEEYEKFREENEERIAEEFLSKLKTAWLDNFELEKLDERIEEVNSKIKNLYYELDDKEYDTELTEEESNDRDYLYKLKIGVEDGHYSGVQLTISDEYDFDHLSQGVRDKILGWVNDIKKEFHLTQLDVAYRFSNGETGYDIVEKKECCKGKKHSHKKPCKDCKGKKKKLNEKTDHLLGELVIYFNLMDLLDYASHNNRILKGFSEDIADADMWDELDEILCEVFPNYSNGVYFSQVENYIYDNYKELLRKLGLPDTTY